MLALLLSLHTLTIMRIRGFMPTTPASMVPTRGGAGAAVGATEVGGQAGAIAADGLIAAGGDDALPLRDAA